MKTRSSGVSQIGVNKWWWWIIEVWEEEGDRCSRERSGIDKTKEEAEVSANVAKGRMEAEEQDERT